MTSVSFREGAWVCPRSSRRLWYRWWQPAEAQATLVIIHGFGEHGGRYEPMARALAEQGVRVIAPDLWGHGRSDGLRGTVDVAACARDLIELTSGAIVSQTGQRHYALFGHSFGGLFVIWWALHHGEHLQRLVVQSPLLEVGFPIPWWKEAAGRLFGSLWPSVGLSMNLDVEALSHDPAVWQAYRTDPLVHHTMTAGAYRSILTSRDEVLAHAETLHIPTLLLCGGADRIISLEVARRWFEALRCQKRSVVFPEAFHELHHETIRDEALRLTREWVVS